MSRKDWKRPELVPLDEGMRRIKLTCAYEGSAFHGWQSQDNSVSVQETLEGALASMGLNTRIQGSGRTDAGVHALGQVCHFDIPSSCTIPAGKFTPALNALLPDTVRVISSEEKDGTFHARFTTMAREYVYFVKSYENALPFDAGHVALYRKTPPVELLNSYAALLQGTHDFSTFSSSRDSSLSKWRDIYESYWTVVTDRFGREMLKYTVVGNAFLYHQVRSMAGTMMDAALSGEDAASFRARLEACDRSKALRTAPADGLYLSRISYDEDEYAWFEEDPDGNGRM